MIKAQSVAVGDILSYLAADGKYKAIICTSVRKETSPHLFEFALTTYDSVLKPTLENILSSEFYGVVSLRNEYFPYSESEVEEMWLIHPEIIPNIIGSYSLIIWKKDLKQFESSLEMVGNVSIVTNVDRNGNGSVNASSWDFLRKSTPQLMENMSFRGQKIYQIKAIVKHRRRNI